MPFFVFIFIFTIFITGAKEPILPAHKFRPGDIVTISQNIKASASVNFSATSGSAKATASGKKSTSTSAPSTSSSASTNASSSSETNDEADTAQGVVYRSSDTRITVALRDPLPSHLQDCVLRLDMGANDVTYKRCCSVLKSLSEDTYSSLPSARLVDVLFGKTEPEFAAEKIDPKKINWVNAGLNEVQKDTIAFALSAKDLALIHGPPGTGKVSSFSILFLTCLIKEAITKIFFILLNLLFIYFAIYDRPQRLLN